MTTQPLAALSVTALFIFLAGCDAESPARTPAITGVLAFEQAAGDAPRFSDWSAPVNLGPVVNSPFIEQGASVSKDGLSLYFHCTGCSTGTGADLYVSQRASVEDPWGPPQRLGSN